MSKQNYRNPDFILLDLVNRNEDNPVLLKIVMITG